jgi:hypothetical protein
MKNRVLTACLLLALSSTSAWALELSSLSGIVKEQTGKPAVGVAVSIRSVGSLLPVERKALSDSKGEFQFLSLFPGIYTLQVFAVDPWNVISKQLVIAPGKNDSLVIHLSDILSMAFKPPRITTVREDPIENAKMVLNTSRVTRPILRFKKNPEAEAVAECMALPFRGVLDISSGNESSGASLAANSFNSSFAFIQPLSARTQLLVAGGFGFVGSNQTSVRSALNIRLDESNTATVSLGLRHFGLSLMNNSELTQTLASLSDTGNSISRVQNILVSVDIQDRAKLGDHVELMAGAAFDHLESVRTKNILRPRLGVSAEITPGFMVRVLAMNTTMEGEKTFTLPEGETISLPSMAHLVLSPNSVRPESVNHVEIGLEHKLSEQSRVIVRLYQDQFRDRTLLLGNLDPVDVEHSKNHGYSFVFQSEPREKLAFSLGYTYTGGLEEKTGAVTVPFDGRIDPQSLQTRYYHMITGGVGFQLPRIQTRINTLYRKILGSPLTILDPFQSAFFAPEGGFNLQITQPLPNFTMLPGQLEAQADFRNLFSQGTSRPGSLLPYSLLSQQPQMIRGGLSFKF